MAEHEQVGVAIEPPDRYSALISSVESLAGQLREALQDARANDLRYARVFEYSNDAMWVIDPSTDEILDGNPNACRLLGYSRQELVSLRTSPIHPENIGAAFMRSVLDQGHGWTDKLTCLTKAGAAIPVEISATTLDFDDRRCILTIARAVAERDQANDAVREMALFAELNPAPVLRFDIKGKILSNNRAAATILDCGAEGGAPLASLLSTMEGVEPGECIRKGLLMVHEAKIGERYFQFTVRGIPELGVGHVYGSDITEHRRADKALQESSQRLQALIQASPLAIWALDRDGNVQMWNPAAEHLFGWSSQEVLGRPYPLVPEDGLDEFRSLREDTLRGESHSGLELRRRNKDGSLIDIAIWTAPTWHAEGDVSGNMAVAVDLTERKRAEEAARRYSEELARSNAELEQFAYVASHDLQEPLRMVTSYTQLLAQRYNDKLDATGREFIAYAVDGATRMQALIGDLLAYSRIGTGGEEYQEIDCNAALTEAMASLRTVVKETEAVITHDPLPTLKADGTQLRQLFQNLISNAIKFRRDEPPRIHVSVEVKEGDCLFAVRDNGIGIAPEDIDRIFVIFQRLHGRGEYPGTGIGLAICKKVVERHGGHIWVESEPGEGSTFFFSIPASGGARE